MLADRAEVEPRLRRSAGLVLTTTVAPPELADAVLRHLAEGGGVEGARVAPRGARVGWKRRW